MILGGLLAGKEGILLVKNRIKRMFGLSGIAVGSNQIDISWSQSTDNVGVTGYNIYRNPSIIISSWVLVKFFYNLHFLLRFICNHPIQISKIIDKTKYFIIIYEHHAETMAEAVLALL